MCTKYRLLFLFDLTLLFISGYRSPKSSALDCFLSIFSATNESLNFWTHFIPALYFLRQIWLLDELSDPIICYMFCLVGFPLTSAVAHVFNCLSDKARHACFFLDYASVSLYSIGSAIAYKAYVFPPSLASSTFSSVYLPVAVINAILSLVISCETRFMKNSRWKKVLRLFAYSIPYFFDSIPIFYRIMACEWDTVILLQLRQCVFAALSAFVYASHIPERWSPGTFDIVGHSHQLFHICTIVATNDQLNALLLDYKAFSSASSSFLWATPMLAAALLGTSVIMFYYIRRIYQQPSHHQIMGNGDTKKKM